MQELAIDVKQVLASVSDAKIDISILKGVGAKLSTIEKAGNLHDDGVTTIVHKLGEVILLDFWATWCPPCQAPMAHNQEMLEKHKEDWQKVRIIGLSIDSDKSDLVSHIDQNKWTSIEHYWARNGECKADKEFNVRGVPHCVLVDTEGMIVWVGHPSSRDLEQDINDLLAGKKLDV
jgi:thiol-disulfide isomerase/thioredoxin